LASTNQSGIRTFRHKTNWVCAPIVQVLLTIRGGVEDVDLRSRHVRIKVGERWYRCWGAETSLGMQLWRKRTSSSARLAGAMALHRRPADAPPEITWRKPTRLEVGVLLFWSALVTFSALHGVTTY
jgi:hypothetical protein